MRHRWRSLGTNTVEEGSDASSHSANLNLSSLHTKNSPWAIISLTSLFLTARQIPRQLCSPLLPTKETLFVPSQPLVHFLARRVKPFGQRPFAPLRGRVPIPHAKERNLLRLLCLFPSIESQRKVQEECIHCLTEPGEGFGHSRQRSSSHRPVMGKPGTRVLLLGHKGQK